MGRHRTWPCAGLLVLGIAAQQPTAPLPAPQPPWTIRARVLDAAGAPLPGAAVLAGAEQDVTSALALAKPATTSGADGTFALALSELERRDRAATTLVIAARGKVGFRVPHVEHLRQWAPRLHANTIDLGDVRLPDGFTLSGRVRGHDGKGLPGARVAAVDCLSPHPWSCPAYGADTRSGAGGVFVLTGVFADAMAVRVSADGYHDFDLPWVDLAQPLDVQLLPSGFVEGTLRDAGGEPVDGFVAIGAEFVDASPSVVRTAGGRFRLPIRAPCRFRVQAWDPLTGRSADSGLLEGPTTGVVLDLDAVGAADVVVRAVDGETGAAVASFRAAAAFWPSDDAEDCERLLAWSAVPSRSDGYVRLRPHRLGGAGKGCVAVFAAGYAPSVATAVVWTAREPFVARLVRESRIAGRVVDGVTRRPLAGVRVCCEPVHEGGPGFGAAMARQQQPFWTAADGSFVFGGLAAREHEITAQWPDGTMAASVRVCPAAGATVGDVVLALDRGATLTGKVTGAMPAGARITCAPQDTLPADGWWTGGGGLDPSRLGGVPIDGATFVVPRRGRGAENLALVVPLPPRHGPALRIPLATVTIGDLDRTIDVDAGTHAPGAIAGKLAIVGADVPRGRFVVVAVHDAKAADAPEWIPANEELARRRWALVGGDGAFRVPVVPGAHRLEVVDVATGVVFARSDDAVVVAAARTTVHDLRVEVVELRVRLETDGARLGAERLELYTGGAERHGATTLFSGGSLGTPGVGLAAVPANGEVAVLVPPGELTMHVGVGACFGDDGFWWGQEPAVQETVTAVLGERGTATLRLPLPR